MNADDHGPEGHDRKLVELKLLVPEDLHRAFQRCLWIRINETGQNQLQLMEEMVRNFLIKHGC
ncbi:hypothetical protein Despr_0306 [Desulfobulbus propionicus DSM 2032]|jgi:hypothetical protein|uniref:Uncharacterized protein n=1 Tax=Desulfobulbus propionicus (strain ATCC 33891 / DSM 2032 / VKM B-1956 / 1pr3) TaxID=577650 RepID=A0A7U3YJE1_DESPD|nr:hypothetical protein [Desulfobulbus propionicus]ADW16490.1 hypothetical protein Despr_0306 [Desulfobulbus propionicus DSM 2032]